MMNLSSWILIFIGGGLGSILRVAMGSWINHTRFLYLSTLFINIIASFLIGYFIQKQISNPEATWLKLLLVSGFCGGLSTFSTFSNENLILIQNGRWLEAIFYSLTSLSSCLIAVWAGYKC